VGRAWLACMGAYGRVFTGGRIQRMCCVQGSTGVCRAVGMAAPLAVSCCQPASSRPLAHAGRPPLTPPAPKPAPKTASKPASKPALILRSTTPPPHPPTQDHHRHLPEPPAAGRGGGGRDGPAALQQPQLAVLRPGRPGRHHAHQPQVRHGAPGAGGLHFFWFGGVRNGALRTPCMWVVPVPVFIGRSCREQQASVCVWMCPRAASLGTGAWWDTRRCLASILVVYAAGALASRPSWPAPLLTSLDHPRRGAAHQPLSGGRHPRPGASRRPSPHDGQ
jgi:hypothetical protein